MTLVKVYALGSLRALVQLESRTLMAIAEAARELGERRRRQ